MEITLKRVSKKIKSGNIVGIISKDINKIKKRLRIRNYIIDRNILKDNRVIRITFSLLDSSNIRFCSDKVKKEIKQYCRKNNEKESKIKYKIIEYLEILNLKDILDKKTKELSDSEK